MPFISSRLDICGREATVLSHHDNTQRTYLREGKTNTHINTHIRITKKWWIHFLFPHGEVSEEGQNKWWILVSNWSHWTLEADAYLCNYTKNIPHYVTQDLQESSCIGVQRGGHTESLKSSLPYCICLPAISPSSLHSAPLMVCYSTSSLCLLFRVWFFTIIPLLSSHLVLRSSPTLCFHALTHFERRCYFPYLVRGSSVACFWISHSERENAGKRDELSQPSVIKMSECKEVTGVYFFYIFLFLFRRYFLFCTLRTCALLWSMLKRSAKVREMTFWLKSSGLIKKNVTIPVKTLK